MPDAIDLFSFEGIEFSLISAFKDILNFGQSLVAFEKNFLSLVSCLCREYFSSSSVIFNHIYTIYIMFYY